ncbi:2-C-methyl-D-erythritol 4-phosphate cytidylyltransferase [Pelagicoccus mobilis]|uniref:2-C-methyl-D-erythritol 4-phosphate cytidylyltransferase n=1 Tax=Pelagicoccus mobilis TaxID=415221 RepID=A0A934S172_9BACT|nr:2-C-methyl-D-erythritol 4-phosphate cytidylyltransferase [Pelagicoccus mobilis]MBK1877992.1 2-C-methyl-D-erythritol 4-phosphate cytidylyltransferase [Pelagicoccus mobilis]
MTIATAILLAGGSGNRMQGKVEDKILAPLAGKPVIAHSIEAFVSSDQVQHLVIVTRDAEQRSELEKIASIVPNRQISLSFTTGGAQRQDSVYAGLQAAPSETQIVLIHDCARPCVTPAAIRESIAKASEFGAACLARPVADTIKSADTYDGAYLPTTVDRSKLWAMETPQTFQYPIILDAYKNIIESGTPITDDLSAIEDIDQPVAFIDNTRPNPKLTTPSDLPYLEYLLQS